jgi:putative ABC transport system permease protein
MYFRLVRSDLVKNKVITLTTVFFVAAAAMLVSLAAILVVNLWGSIDALMTMAKTPHFMQMHTGDIDIGRLSAFARQNAMVDEFQVLEFVNIDGSHIVINGKSLVDNVQDNGFSVQSDKFDYLLALDGNTVRPSVGEVYVPICYMKDSTAQIGDRLVVFGQELVVAGFVRDSQMNSTLSSSKRFLVSPEDLGEIKSLGSTEYLIEFRLKDLSGLREFETAYISAGLEANGPTLTYPLFKTINAISDGMMIAVLLLVSALVVAIAFMCIRFTLLAKIEDDYREIGVMKAVGMRVSDIKKIYLAQYAAMALAGSALGYALSLGLRGLLLENIRLYMGESGNASLAPVLGIVGVAIVFLVLIAYVNGLLRKFSRISAADAIRFGTSQEKPNGKNRIWLSKNRLLETNIFLGVRDVLARKGLYGTILVVLVTAAFIIAVPQNLHNTISSKSFIRYMGIGDYDMRFDLQQGANMDENARAVVAAMAGDRDIARYVALTTKSFSVQTDAGLVANLNVELGDHGIFPVDYSQGRAPTEEGEIALSVINASELNVKVGDIITLVIDGRDTQLAVCGIYSDITNGGKTAKAVFDDNSASVMWSIVCAELTDKTLISGKVREYTERFAFAKVTGVDEFVAQTFGTSITSVGKAAYASLAVATVITALITVLFMKMLIAKDRYSIAVMKACGFRNSDIRLQYVSRSVLVVIAGVFMGTLLANTLGGMLAGKAMASFGGESFRFVVNPVLAYLLMPLLMAGTVLLATWVGTSGAGRTNLLQRIKE